MMYSQRSKKNSYLERKQQPKGSYSRKPPATKELLHRTAKNK